GGLPIDDGQPHFVQIALTDAFNNVSNISFYLLSVGDGDAQPCKEQRFEANKVNKYEHPNVILTLDDKALYDNTCFDVTAKTDVNSFSDRYTIGQSYVLLHTYNELKIKPNKAVGFDIRDKMVLMYSDGKSESGKAAEYDNGWYKARTRNLGTYYLLADTEPPVVKSQQADNANLAKAK